MADSKLLCVSHKVTTSYTQLVSYEIIYRVTGLLKSTNHDTITITFSIHYISYTVIWLNFTITPHKVFLRTGNLYLFCKKNLKY